MQNCPYVWRRSWDATCLVQVPRVASAFYTAGGLWIQFPCGVVVGACTDSLTYCWFLGWSILWSRTDQSMGKALVHWLASSGAQPRSSFVVIETLWVLHICLMTYSFCVWASGLYFSTFILIVLRCCLLASSCKFLLLGGAWATSTHCYCELWTTALLLLSHTEPWLHGSACSSVASDKPGWSCQ